MAVILGSKLADCFLSGIQRNMHDKVTWRTCMEVLLSLQRVAAVQHEQIKVGHARMFPTCRSKQVSEP